MAARRVDRRDRNNAASIFRDYFGEARNAARAGARDNLIVEDDGFIYVDGEEEEMDLDDEELIELGGGVVVRAGENNNNNVDEDEEDEDEDEDEDDDEPD